jgi:type I restriction enzyme S subunit
LIELYFVRKETLKSYLEEFNERVGNRNMQTASVGVLGIRSRTEVFDKELSNDYSNNKVIYKHNLCYGIGTNQIVYGLMENEMPYCVSPAYRTFKIVNINPYILKMELDNTNKLFSLRHMIVSARQGKSVDFKGLLNESIKVPDKDEENNIVNIVLKYEDNLKIHNELYNYLLKLKNTLLLYMFI